MVYMGSQWCGTPEDAVHAMDHTCQAINFLLTGKDDCARKASRVSPLGLRLLARVHRRTRRRNLKGSGTSQTLPSSVHSSQKYKAGLVMYAESQILTERLADLG